MFIKLFIIVELCEKDLELSDLGEDYGKYIVVTSEDIRLDSAITTNTGITETLPSGSKKLTFTLKRADQQPFYIAEFNFDITSPTDQIKSVTIKATTSDGEKVEKVCPINFFVVYLNIYF